MVFKELEQKSSPPLLSMGIYPPVWALVYNLLVVECVRMQGVGMGKGRNM